MKYIILSFVFLLSTTHFARQKQVDFLNLSEIQLFDSENRAY